MKKNRLSYYTITITILSILYLNSGFAQNVSITDDDSYIADSSAMLDVKSTTKGFLAPRMTTVQKNAITTPATGLMVYDTTLNKVCVYTGAGWETMTSV